MTTAPAPRLILRRERPRILPPALEAALQAVGGAAVGGASSSETSKIALKTPGGSFQAELQAAAVERLLTLGLPQGEDEAFSTVRVSDLLPALSSPPQVGPQARWSEGASWALASETQAPAWLLSYLSQATDTAGHLALALASTVGLTLPTYQASGPVSGRVGGRVANATASGTPGREQGEPTGREPSPGASLTSGAGDLVWVWPTLSGQGPRQESRQDPLQGVVAAGFKIASHHRAQLGLRQELNKASRRAPFLANGFIWVHVEAEACLDLWLTDLQPEASTDSPDSQVLGTPSQAAAPVQSLMQVVIRQEAGSRLRLHLGSTGNALARTAVHLELAGPGAEAEVYGTSALVHNRQCHRHLHILHAAPDTVSKQLFKTAATDQGRGSVDGTVEVAPQAKGTRAAQTLRNLLLSDAARLDSKPRLLIRNDDVKCNHGATTGRLDPAQRFYLRSRGLSDAEAVALLTGAFLHETLDIVPPGPHRQVIEGMLPTLLHGRP